MDEPVVWYEGSGTTDRRWLQADERGSVVAITDASGNAITLNRYDEYGIPQSTNLGRFQYTGQVWLGEVGLYHYKARIYSPTLGRFMQTDPIGYADGMNWYNYASSDPVNATDPAGTDDIVVFGYGGYDWGWDWGLGWDWTYYDLSTFGGVWGGGDISDISEDSQGNPVVTVTAKRPTNNTDRSFLFDFGMASWTWQANALAGGGAGASQESSQSGKSIWDRAKDLYCSLPPLGVSGSAGGYRGLGAGVTFSATFDPQSGRLGISGGPNVGVGIGASVDGSISATAGGGVPNGVTGSVGWNASVRVPGYRFGTGGTFIGSGGLTDPTPNAVSGGWAPGGGVTANANLTARGAVGGQVLPSC